jgi:S-formylglutathione hydrolase FrmB
MANNGVYCSAVTVSSDLLRSRRRRLLTGVASLVLALTVVPALPSTAEPIAHDSVVAYGGLGLRDEQALSPRLTNLRVHSPAMERELNVRVLTPAGFDPARDRLPVLWLLHGGFGSAPDWTTAGNAEALTAGLPMIVVMPDAGTGGWYSNWRSATLEGPQQWETFHLDELRPFIEDRYNTRTDRGGRAVAGLSMGGFGAMHYAARHPDLFGFAAAFSGAVDILHPGVGLVVSASPFAHQGLPIQLYGDRITDESRWRANNPVDLAANLRTVELQIRTGNGMPGGPHGGSWDPIEIGCYQASTTLHQRLTELGIDHVWDDRGAGAHTWEYWRDHLADTLPGMVDFFARSASEPAEVEHVALEPTFSVWGHDVVLDRPVYESAVLSVRPDGFGLTGTGRGTVTSPARYEPGQAVVAHIASGGGEPSELELVADDAGRVTVPVDLGMGSLVPEHPLGYAAALPRQHVDVILTPVPANGGGGDGGDDPVEPGEPGPGRPEQPGRPEHPGRPGGAPRPGGGAEGASVAAASAAGTPMLVADPLAHRSDAGPSRTAPAALALVLAAAVAAVGLRRAQA